MSDDSAPINLTNHFLIAMPGLEDEAFAQSVVYLCEHSERGALGLVINKPSDIKLQNLFDKVDLPQGRTDLKDIPAELVPLGHLAPTGAFVVRVLGEPGVTYVLEATSDFTRWEPVATGSPQSPDSYVDLSDAAAKPNQARFYRAKSL